MNLKTFTIVLTVAPSGSGKTYFIENYALPQLRAKYPKITATHISSDNIRRELLGDPNAHKYDRRMMQVSAGAFKLLMERLRQASSYPVNNEIIFVDTTGLNSDFRNEIVSVAKENNYHIDFLVFDYKTIDEYLLYNDGDDLSQQIISGHVKRLHQNMGQLRGFDQKHKIGSKFFQDIEIVVDDYEEYTSRLIEGDTYTVVGDVHGSYDELIDVVTAAQGKLIFVGDIVDKNNKEDILRTIDLVYTLMLNGNALFVRGNHENFVVKYLRGEIKNPQPELLDTWFTTTKILDDEYKEKLFYIYDNGKEFYRHVDFTVTHAPTVQKYLWKMDNNSLKKQRNFVYPKRADYESEEAWKEAVYKAFSFLSDENQYGFPIHIWGHVAMSEPFKNKSNFGIDTGVADGGKLTYVNYVSGKFYLHSVESTREKKPLLDSIVKPRQVEAVDLSQLDRDLLLRLKWMGRNGVNFISGTMSPADKKGDQLESLDAAFDLYKQLGITKVILQPKYMGSRGQVYLFQDVEKSYSVSRNGYRVRDEINILLRPEYQRLIDRFNSVFETAELIILDAELLPWRLLGAGLIDREFYGIAEMAASELKYLKDTGFEDQLLKWDFGLVDVFGRTKSEVIKEFGHHIWSIYEASQQYKFPSIYEQELDILEYVRQVDLYGKDDEVQIKPFTILKIVNKDGTEIIYDKGNNAFLWEIVTDDWYHFVDLEDEVSIEYAHDAFKALTTHFGYEGAVVKPVMFSEGTLPYLKVRNENYLNLPYGIGYKRPNKYNRILAAKKIGSKVKQSMNDWKRGLAMLRIPYNQVNEDNLQLMTLFLQHINDEDSFKEKADPRL